MVIVSCAVGPCGVASCGGGVAAKAFNFTDYGLIEGTVETISRDAIDQRQEDGRGAREGGGEGGGDGLVYAARIVLACGASDGGRSSLCDRVQPGMAVQAEIKTGRRRIVQYVLSPISAAVNEAGRER